jgi:hypothetical protein
MGSFVATKTMTVRGEDGEMVDLAAGQSFIHDEQHHLIRTYPDLWAPTSKRTTRHRQRGVQTMGALTSLRPSRAARAVPARPRRQRKREVRLTTRGAAESSGAAVQPRGAGAVLCVVGRARPRRPPRSPRERSTHTAYNRRWRAGRDSRRAAGPVAPPMERHEFRPDSPGDQVRGSSRPVGHSVCPAGYS